MLRIVRDVAELRQPRAIRRARPLDPGYGEARDHARRDERQLEAGVGQRGRLPEQENEGRERDGVEQLDAAEEGARAPVERGDERGAIDRRAVLHGTDVGDQGSYGDEARERDRKSQSAAQQKKKTVSAPTCRPATTSTWYAAVF